LASSEARPTTILESPTVSLALDRIDQHDLPLDRTFAHSATTGRGHGLRVRRWNSPNHPELAGRVRIGYTGFSDDPKNLQRTRHRGRGRHRRRHARRRA
jgi:hypothetical protein